MSRKRSTPWAWIIGAFVCLFFVGIIGLSFIAAVVGGDSALGERIALINFYGEISDQEGGKLFGARGSRDFIKDLEDAREDKSIKAVVLRINSPGGSAAASQELYQAIRRLREKKPVVCSMGDAAASGGYYMAAACNKIYANPATLTGSIGVISQFMNMEGLLKKLGVQGATFKSGKFKDSGSPFRQLRPDERQLFQAMIGDIYQQFVNDIVAGRKEATNGKLTREALMKIADGRVFTGRQAKAKLLIDELGGLHEAIEAAGKLGGIKGKPKVRSVSGGSGLGGLMGSEASTANSGFSAFAQSVGSAFAQGFTRTFLSEVREDASTSAMPRAR